MGRRLYGRNLSTRASGSQRKELFAPIEDAEEADVVQDRQTDRSRRFGFVEMTTVPAAKAAIRGSNHRDQNGRPLIVIAATPRSTGGFGPHSGHR